MTGWLRRLRQQPPAVLLAVQLVGGPDSTMD